MPGQTDLEVGTLINEEKYRQTIDQYGTGSFEAAWAARPSATCWTSWTWSLKASELREDMKDSTSEAKRKKLAKRLRVLEALKGMEPDVLVKELSGQYPRFDPDSETGRFLEEILQTSREIQVKWEETSDWEVRKQLAYVEINNVSRPPRPIQDSAARRNG